MPQNLSYHESDLMKIVNCFIVQRSYMYNTKKCPVDRNQREALDKIKRHVEHCKNWNYNQQIKVIKYLLPDFETIMPGVHSKKYADMENKLNTIKYLINE